jgi:SAM-dependent methyltransferase
MEMRQVPMEPVEPEDPWERHADWWQEEFTEGADPEYEEQIVPLFEEHAAGSARLLDVGTGEGQLARAASRLGVPRVVGLDPTMAQLAMARERGGGPGFVRGSGAQLPFAGGAFDVVVACLVFEHIVDYAEAISEVARVLEPGGRFLFFLNHPLLQTPNSGWIDDHILDEQYWRIGPYLVEDLSEEEVAPGVRLPFFHRPLSRYVNAMAEVGLLIERMDEPAPPPGFLERAVEYREAASIPRLLFLRASKRS